MNRPLLLLSLLSLSACVDDVTQVGDSPLGQQVALRGIHVVISDGNNQASTRLAYRDNEVPILVDSVGRYTFDSNDLIRFTTIQRTTGAIPEFTYLDKVSFACTTTAGSISWQQVAPDDDLYWSDGYSAHTFVGYMLPHDEGKSAEESGYDWKNVSGIYYGSIGNPLDLDEVIDYSCEPGPDVKPDKAHDILGYYESKKLQREDLLLTYDTELINEDAIAWLVFHHALSCVRVIVTLTGFAATDDAVDTKSTVSDMVLEDQPVMYRWRNDSYKAEPLASSDQPNLNEAWSGASTTPAWDQKKNIKLWQPRVWSGSGANRIFTFYGITTPGEQETVKVNFKVTYPDPLNPDRTVQKPYTATIMLPDARKVDFVAGYCTSININLNHRNEKMTVGTEYMSWQYVDAPDQGNLYKKSTFLTDDRNCTNITIQTDAKATVDDATWLYVDATKGLIDIYGHKGNSANDPYTITSADELLSFCYEVNNGYTFKDKYVKLDANIYLQPDTKQTNVSWPGIGTEDFPFQGYFLGEGRSVKRLKGSPFFVNIGPLARVSKLSVDEVVQITSEGSGAAFAKINDGVICGCTVASTQRQSTTDSDGETSIVNSGFFDIKAMPRPSGVSGEWESVAGPLVGLNRGIIMACHSQGAFETDAQRVGGLVAYNTGDIVVSYAATRASTSYSGGEVLYRGIVAYNDYAPDVLPAGKTANEYGRIFYCFFDNDIANNVTAANTLEYVHAMTTVKMQSSSFIGARTANDDTTLNGSINKFAQEYQANFPKELVEAYRKAYLSDYDSRLAALAAHFAEHYYVHQVASYPKVY